VRIVALAAGDALIALGFPPVDPTKPSAAPDRAARDALLGPDASLEDPVIRPVVVLAYLRDLDALADQIGRLERGDPRALAVTNAVLEEFAAHAAAGARQSTPDGIRRHGAWVVAQQAAKGWRLLDLAARVRAHPDLAEVAARAMRAGPPEEREAAQKRYPAARPVSPARETQGPYRGDAGPLRDWDDFATASALDDAERARALELARERMRRVARRADVICERLRAHGWPLREDARRPATTPEPLAPDPFLGEVPTHRVASAARTSGDLDVILAEAEAAIGGRVPVTLEAFWREVGQIDLSPRAGATLPDWVKDDLDAFDPLVVLGPPIALTAIDEWRMWRAESTAPELEDALVTVAVSPDRYDETTGHVREALELVVPDAQFDPPFVGRERSETLASQLELALRWGGFPGLGRLAKRKKRHRRIVDELTDGLDAL
jgi:hypothetical protein